jgi:hypothetical protein
LSTSEVMTTPAPRAAPNGTGIFLWFCFVALLTNVCYALAGIGETALAGRVSAALYLASFMHLYTRRKENFGFFLVMAISYSLLFGIPCVAWVLSNPLNNAAQIVFLLGILSTGNLLTLLSHCEALDKRHNYVPFTFEPNKAFVVVLAVVALAQAYKLRAYLGVLTSSEYGHLAIWLESEMLLSSVPSWIRILSGGSLLTGIIGIALFRKRPFMQCACLLLIISDMVLGIRNKGFFGVLAAIYILSLFERDKASRIFQRVSSPIMLAVAFLALSIVSFLREGFDIPLSDYLVIVLDSLASIANGLLETISDPSQCAQHLDGTLVFSQLWNLLGIGSGTQLSAEFNYCLTGNPNPLTSVSSSMIFEMLLVAGPFWPMAAGLYLLALYGALRFLERRRSIVSLSLLCALAPAILYTLRAELVQPIVFILKSLPYILLIGLLMSRNSRQGAAN